MTQPIIVTGYHGTLKAYVDAITTKGFNISTNPWEWLGDGIYFWQDALTVLPNGPNNGAVVGGTKTGTLPF